MGHSQFCVFDVQTEEILSQKIDVRPAASVSEIFAVDRFNPDMIVNLLILTYLFFVKKIEIF